VNVHCLEDDYANMSQLRLGERRRAHLDQHENTPVCLSLPIVMLLGTLAHNVVIWARGWLTQTASPSKLQHYGIKRMVRDVF
jgi:hypothetical protein